MLRRARLLLCPVILAFGLAACTRMAANAPPNPLQGNRWTLPGVLRIDDTRQPDNLNPLLSFGQVPTDLSMFWAAYLFRWNDRNQLVPELATVVPTIQNGGISPDGLTVTYHLRKGVRWQDGAPFGPGDVIFTWQQVMNPHNNVQSRVGYDAIAAIDAASDHVIRVHLRHPFAPFVETFFTMADATYCILPRHLLAGYPDINNAPYNSLPIGTGPFRIVEYNKGSDIRMVANTSYWRGPPRLKEIDYRIVPDDSTILTQLRSHETDFWMAAPIVHSASLTSLPGTRVFQIPFTAFEFLGFNTDRGPLSDVRVRRALRYATDVPKLGAVLAHGKFIPAPSDQPPFLWAYNAHAHNYNYDPARAGELLDAAGWKLGADGYRYKNGQPLDLLMVSAIGSALGSQIDVLVQHDWKQVGVRVDIKTYPTDLLGGADGIYRTGRFDVFFDSWSNGVDPDDSQIFMCQERPPYGANYFRFCDARLDAAEQMALRYYPRAQRKPAYDTIQSILANELPVIILWFDVRQDVANSDLKGYKPAHAVTTFWNPWEWSI